MDSTNREVPRKETHEGAEIANVVAEDCGRLREDVAKISVAVRVRPFLPSELKRKKSRNSLGISPEGKQVTLKFNLRESALPASLQDSKHNVTTEKAFSFDHVFGTETTQQDIFENLGMPAILQKAIDGYNCTVFAYGQTGSGKTHTMDGFDFDEQLAYGYNRKTSSATGGVALSEDSVHISVSKNDNFGLVPRSIVALFAALDGNRADKNTTWSVSCTHVQLYNECAYDLLNQNNGGPGVTLQSNSVRGPGLKMRWASKGGFYLQNLFEVTTETAEETLHLFRQSARNKVVSSHDLNPVSSRSHCIFTITIKRQSLDAENLPEVRESRLCLVDLAGSERVSQTNSTGVTFTEAIGINKSLSVLRKVIVALATEPDRSHIPYRDSKLTSLLQESLGGNCVTLMIACVAPGDDFIDENHSTLKYASHASNIRNVAIVNVDSNSRTISNLRLEVQRLRNELRALHNVVGSLNTEKHLQKSTSKNAEGVSEELANAKRSLLDHVLLFKDVFRAEESAVKEVQKQQKYNLVMKRDNELLHDENMSLRDRIRVLQNMLLQGGRVRLE
jgi:hypothetical protein